MEQNHKRIYQLEKNKKNKIMKKRKRFKNATSKEYLLKTPFHLFGCR